MKYRAISFHGFDGRKEELEAIERFKSLSPMHYRTNDYSHSHRVLWLAEDILPYAVTVFPNLNVEMTRTLSPTHDDPEIIIGDIELDQKLKMSVQELHQLEQDESAAIEILAARFPKMINGFNYRELLYHALRKNSIEAQLVSYVDKIDAREESRHEIAAGNKLFIPSAQRYDAIFKAKETRWPLITSLFGCGHPFFTEMLEQDLETIAKKGTFHTPESIQQRSGDPAYDCWKRITIERCGIESLVTVKES
ncbi:MAG: HD domain-containing protein [Nanoarchaeota archaeon]|nr:HD domain-containing protein [Nanoarchaeota archaeon]